MTKKTTAAKAAKAAARAAAQQASQLAQKKAAVRAARQRGRAINALRSTGQSRQIDDSNPVSDTMVAMDRKLNQRIVVPIGAATWSKPSRNGSPLLRGATQAYLEALAKPFDCLNARSSVNYNPVPSLFITPGRTTATTDLAVNAGQSSGLILAPGHGGVYGIAAGGGLGPMDGNSYHSQLQNIGVTPTLYSIGPMAVSGVAGHMGGFTYTSTASGLNTLPTGSNIAGVVPLAYDVLLPYSSTVGGGSHSRWKLVSAGIRITNTTVLANRESEIVIVQPQLRSNVVTGAAIQSMANNPSYSFTTKAFDKVLEIPWIPRVEDMAFWHTATTTVAQNSYEWAGLIVHIPNPTAVTQNYHFEVVWNWELAGESLLAVSAPASHSPADKQILEPAMAIVRASDSYNPAVALPRVANALNEVRVGRDKGMDMSEVVLKHATAVGSILAEKGVKALMGMLA